MELRDVGMTRLINNSAVIRFSVPEKLSVTLKLYDILGSESPPLFFYGSGEEYYLRGTKPIYN
jgi:hypothetical protein